MLLFKDAIVKDCNGAEIQAVLDHYYHDVVLENDGSSFMTNLIEMAAGIKKSSGWSDEAYQEDLAYTADKANVLPIICGAGKSTTISYLIRRVIQRNDGNGIWIVTDSVPRMEDYIKPIDSVPLNSGGFGGTQQRRYHLEERQ